MERNGFKEYQVTLTYSKYDQNRIYANRIWPKAKYHCCFPLSLNERYSGETGCNYEITWYNN